MSKKYKISFFTVCMNRLHHLKETLPKNIEDNLAYGNVEFVVLNYNSNDGMDEWIKNEMHPFIKSGILKYFKTNEPKVFHMSHSKNVVARCTSGDIICNIDADNFIGENFADYINKQFLQQKNIFLTTDKGTASRDCYGRICMKKYDFLKCTGYDESMELYGFEDIDLKNRLGLLSLKKRIIENRSFLNAIDHTDEERLKNDNSLSQVECIFIKNIDYASYILMFLYKNATYFKGELLKNRYLKSRFIENLFAENRAFEYEYSLSGNQWEAGTWLKEKGGLKLTNEKESFIMSLDEFKKVEDEEDKLSLTMFFSQITNRNKMVENKNKKLIVVNPKSFGKANLIKNFKEKIQLH